MAFDFGFGAIGGVISPIYASTLIDAFGWRGAYTVMGLSWGGIAFLFCYPFFHSRLDTVREPRKDVKAEQPKPGYTFHEGLRSAAFAKLVLSVLLANSLYVGVHVHMVPMLMQSGMPRGEAAWIVGLCITAAVPGQLLCGWLADRMHGTYISAVSIAILALTCALLLIKTDSLILRILPAITVSVVGGERAHMIPYLSSRYFGLRAFGRIFGFVSSAIAISVGLGPLVAGYVYDTTHSYDLLLMSGIPICAVAIALTLALGKYPEHKLEAEPAALNPQTA
jgi:MFS family permease